MEKWPNLFIVGAPKSSTTSLHGYLNNIPDIFMSTIKEPNYFSAATVSIKHPVKPIRDKKKYLDLFNQSIHQKYLGEASTSYLADPDAPKLIHQVSPEAKIIISLRDPIERLFSHYLMYIRDGWWNNSFKEQISNELNHQIDPSKRTMELSTSFYYENIKRYFDIFGEKQVKIIIFEEFVKNPQKTLEEILEFLDITHTFTNFKPIKYNPYVEVSGQFKKLIRRNETIRRIVNFCLPKDLRLYIRYNVFIKDATKPKMNEADKEFLIELYRSDFEKTQSLLGRILPWNNFSKPVD